MQKSIFQDKSPEERIIYLRDTCDKLEDFTYEKSYTNQDVELFCERLSKIMIDVRQMETELSKIKKEHAEKMKPLKIELSELLNNIKFRSKMVKEKVYIFIDHEKNQVGYYTSEGILVYTRMLKIDEHQRSIMSSARNFDPDEDEDENDEKDEDDEDDENDPEDAVFVVDDEENEVA